MTLKPRHQVVAHRLAVMIVDIQQQLLPHINENEGILQRASRLLTFCRLLDLPIVVTEQYPKGLGPTVAQLTQLLPPNTERLEKTTFSCIRNDGIATALAHLGRKRVVVAGIEAHICVAQTVRDLLSCGYEVLVLSDCVGSRSPTDCAKALDRMRDEGATITTLEALMYETLVSSRHPQFKEFMAKVMK